MDPNWFYSTLAQSTAAIVGLAGAFMVQRLLAQRAEIGPTRSKLRLRCQELARDIEGERRNIEIIGESLARAEREAESQRGAESIRITGTVHAFSLDSGPLGQQGMDFHHGFDPTDVFHRARGVLDEYTWALPPSFDALATAIREEGGMQHLGPAWLSQPAWESADRPPQGAGVFAWLERQDDVVRERLRRFRTAAEDLGRDLTDLRAKLVPASFYALLMILSGLLAAGVIAPMFFLSAKDGVSRPALLTLFIPLALGFVAFFGYELWRLRRADRLVPETF
jgi:hypothetical protein